MEQTVTIKLDIRDAHSLFVALLGVEAKSMLNPTVSEAMDHIALRRIDFALEKLLVQLECCVCGIVA